MLTLSCSRLTLFHYSLPIYYYYYFQEYVYRFEILLNLVFFRSLQQYDSITEQQRLA